jgi:hypothetical protein
VDTMTLDGELLTTARASAWHEACNRLDDWADISIDPGLPEATHRTSRLLRSLGELGMDPSPESVEVDEISLRQLRVLARADLDGELDQNADEFIAAARGGGPPATPDSMNLARLIIAIDESGILEPRRRPEAVAS